MPLSEAEKQQILEKAEAKKAKEERRVAKARKAYDEAKARKAGWYWARFSEDLDWGIWHYSPPEDAFEVLKVLSDDDEWGYGYWSHPGVDEVYGKPEEIGEFVTGGRHE